jgi:hypothetical protein
MQEHTMSLLPTLGFGFLAFCLSALSLSMAEAADCETKEVRTNSRCPAGSREVKRVPLRSVQDSVMLTCCSTPSDPYATGETKAERQQREARECKTWGADYRYDPQTGKCTNPDEKKSAPPPPPCPEGQMRLKGICQKPPVDPESKTGKKGGFIQMKPNCAEGFVYSESENNCVAAPAAEQPNKKKKKKKKKHDDD